MSSTLFEKSAKVLFFATLDESYSVRLAEEIFKNESKDLEGLRLINQSLKKNRNKTQKVKPIKGHFSFPIGVDISHWREFRLNASSEDFEAILYKWIGQFSDQEIMEVCEISEGTLKSRYNSGLRSLGALLIKEHV